MIEKKNKIWNSKLIKSNPWVVSDINHEYINKRFLFNKIVTVKSWTRVLI